MAEEKSTGRDIELDNQGRIVLNVPELINRLQEESSQPAALRPRSSININCFGCPGDGGGGPIM